MLPFGFPRRITTTGQLYTTPDTLVIPSWVKWNESGFRPPLCTYRLNWARRTSWGLWDDWDDTVLQTQVSKFEPWRSEAEHATSRSRRLPTILTFTHGWRRNISVSFKPPRPETEPRTLAPPSWASGKHFGPALSQRCGQVSVWVGYLLPIWHSWRLWCPPYVALTLIFFLVSGGLWSGD